MEFKRQSFWSDEYTFPDALDTGETFDAKNIDDAVEKTIKETIKPQIRRFIETEVESEDYAVLTYFPNPSKNKTGYCETIEIEKC